jgi:hypothetical protein
MFIYKNLTPHAITLRSRDGVDMVLPPSGIVPRVEESVGEEMWEAGDLGVRIFTAPTRGAVVGLPSIEDGVLLIVSGLVAAACGGRFDVFSPGTGPNDGCVREKGMVIAVTRLIQASRA